MTERGNHQGGTLRRVDGERGIGKYIDREQERERDRHIR